MSEKLHQLLHEGALSHITNNKVYIAGFSCF